VEEYDERYNRKTIEKRRKIGNKVDEYVERYNTKTTEKEEE
jgi:hypothetical protein